MSKVWAGEAGAKAIPSPPPGASANARTGPAIPPTSAQSAIAPRERSCICVSVSASTPTPMAATGTQ